MMVTAIAIGGEGEGGGERAADALLDLGGRRERPMRDFAQNGPV